MKNCTRFMNIILITPPEERQEVILLFQPTVHKSSDSTHTLISFNDNSHIILWAEDDTEEDLNTLLFETTAELEYYLDQYGLPSVENLSKEDQLR